MPPYKSSDLVNSLSSVYVSNQDLTSYYRQIVSRGLVSFKGVVDETAGLLTTLARIISNQNAQVSMATPLPHTCQIWSSITSTQAFYVKSPHGHDIIDS